MRTKTIPTNRPSEARSSLTIVHVVDRPSTVVAILVPRSLPRFVAILVPRSLPRFVAILVPRSLPRFGALLGGVL